MFENDVFPLQLFITAKYAKSAKYEKYEKSESGHIICNEYYVLDYNQTNAYYFIMFGTCRLRRNCCAGSGNLNCASIFYRNQLNIFENSNQCFNSRISIYAYNTPNTPNTPNPETKQQPSPKNNPQLHPRSRLHTSARVRVYHPLKLPVYMNPCVP